MKQGGISADFLHWQDVLHEGFVPAGLSLPELYKVRAGYIASLGWTSEKKVLESFNERDKK